MKLAKLGSRVATLDTRHAAVLPDVPFGSDVQRLRGRAGVARRERFLRGNPLCVECKREGRTTVASVPDHKVPLWDGGPDTEANLQALCNRHHEIKTAREAADRSRRLQG